MSTASDHFRAKMIKARTVGKYRAYHLITSLLDAGRGTWDIQESLYALQIHYAFTKDGRNWAAVHTITDEFVEYTKENPDVGVAR